MDIPIPCPDPKALHLFPEPWLYMQAYTQDLPSRLSPEHLEYIFEYILSGGARLIPLERWNQYFQIKSLKTSLSTTRGLVQWKKFCEDKGVTSFELQSREDRSARLKEDRQKKKLQQNDQDLQEKRKQKVTIPPNSFPCLPC